MSKKNRPDQSYDLMKQIGQRLNKSKKTEQEDSSPSDMKDKKTEQEDSSPSDMKDNEIDKKDNSDGWFDDREPYRSSFIVKPDMEDDFEDCRRKFRKHFRMNISKQNAIELGWLLLKLLDEKYFNKVKAFSSPDDDLISSLKGIIKKESY